MTDNDLNFSFDPMDDYHRLIAETDTVPEEDVPVESRAARRAREEAEQRESARNRRQPRRAKPKTEEELPEDDPFWSLSKKKASAEASEPAPTADESGDRPEKGKRRGSPKKPGKPKKEKPEPDPEAQAKKAEQVRSGRLTLIVLAVVLALIFAGATAGGYYVTNSAVNLPNVYVGGIFVGGMTREQTDAALLSGGWDESVDTVLRVKLPAGVSFKLDSCDSGAKLTRADAVEAAYSFGHSENWYSNLFKFLLNHLAPTDVNLNEKQLDSAYIKARIAQGAAKLDRATADEGYVIDKERETLTVIKGAGQVKLDQQALYSAIEQALLSDQRVIEFDQLSGSITMPDFKKLHDELAVEPSDAYFSEDFQVVEEVDGCWFDADEAERLWQEAKPIDKVVVPMKLTYPAVTGEDLNAMLYRDKLGSQTTYYTWSSDNRINNINLAAGKLDGIILMPGQELSYNETVGQRTEEAGFLPAGAYDDGQVVEEIGGGICQVSSTLYCAIMLSQLDTVSRTNHYFKVDYLDYGLDATVSWPKPDFKFRNSRDYPIRISAYCDNEEHSLTIEIWGTDVDGSYVTLRHSSLCVYDTEYPEVCIGYGVSAYRTVYDAEGNFMYEIEEPYGIYNFHEENIEWPAEKFMTDAEKAALAQADTADVPSQEAPADTGDTGGEDSYQ